MEMSIEKILLIIKMYDNKNIDYNIIYNKSTECKNNGLI